MTAVADSSEFFILPPWVLDPGASLPADPRTRLREMLQVALQVEFSTIPPYLTALYSIKDKDSQAYHLVRSVVMEEMVHLNLVGNLLNAVGGTPKLVRSENDVVVFPPKFPQSLSDQAKGGGPYLQLMAASPQLFRETFMKIEQPAQPDAPAEEFEFSTIGQLYKTISDTFREYDADTGYEDEKYDIARQTDDWNFGNNGGTVIVVDDLNSALKAINEIVEQGEGADLTNEPGSETYRITQPWGQYEYYGPRADGTYGPVLGAPVEMSHYFKFKSIADGVTPLPAVYPMIANPSTDKYANSVAKDLSLLFDCYYSDLVDELQKAMQAPGEDPDARRRSQERFFTSVVPLMRVALPVLATQLMQTPVAGTKRTTVDPTAGPSFTYVPDLATRRNAPALLAKLVEEVRDGKREGAPDSLIPALNKVAQDVKPSTAASKE